MNSRLSSAFLVALVAAASFPRASFGQRVETQGSESALPSIVQSKIDNLALRIANQIIHQKFEPPRPKVFILEYSSGQEEPRTRLSSLLADRLSDSLVGITDRVQALDPKTFFASARQNYYAEEDLRNTDFAVIVARELGATGVLLVSIQKVANENLRLIVRPAGLGRIWLLDTVLPSTEQMRQMLNEPTLYPLPRSQSESIPEEPGVYKGGVGGVSPPSCIKCPDPPYTDLARSLGFQGTVVLSLVVTPEGKVTSIRIVKAAPGGLTQQAIRTMQKALFKPAMKEGKPVAVRVNYEITFRLF
jgi:TonB family protein